MSTDRFAKEKALAKKIMQDMTPEELHEFSRKKFTVDYPIETYRPQCADCLNHSTRPFGVNCYADDSIYHKYSAPDVKEKCPNYNAKK